MKQGNKNQETAGAKIRPPPLTATQQSGLRPGTPLREVPRTSRLPSWAYRQPASGLRRASRRVAKTPGMQRSPDRPMLSAGYGVGRKRPSPTGPAPTASPPASRRPATWRDDTSLVSKAKRFSRKGDASDLKRIKAGGMHWSADTTLERHQGLHKRAQAAFLRGT